MGRKVDVNTATTKVLRFTISTSTESRTERDGLSSLSCVGRMETSQNLQQTMMQKRFTIDSGWFSQERVVARQQVLPLFLVADWRVEFARDLSLAEV